MMLLLKVSNESLTTIRHGQEMQPKIMAALVDPLTSILADLARSCQILTTSWRSHGKILNKAAET